MDFSLITIIISIIALSIGFINSYFQFFNKPKPNFYITCNTEGYGNNGSIDIFKITQ